MVSLLSSHLCYAIADFPSAHYQATQLHIIHRDVSSGNILILPRIVTYPDGSRSVQYTGVLTDWELSKGLLDPRKPRQPERTVSALTSFSYIRMLTRVAGYVAVHVSRASQ